MIKGSFVQTGDDAAYFDRRNSHGEFDNEEDFKKRIEEAKLEAKKILTQEEFEDEFKFNLGSHDPEDEWQLVNGTNNLS